MKKFIYSMQKILDIKKKSREQEELNFARLTKLLKKEKGKLFELNNERVLLQEEMIKGQSVGISIVNIMNMQKYIDHLDYLILAQIKKIKRLDENLVIKRQYLIDLKIDEKKHLMLREKKLAEYLVRASQIEQIELDEIGARLSFR